MLKYTECCRCLKKIRDNKKTRKIRGKPICKICNDCHTFNCRCGGRFIDKDGHKTRDMYFFCNECLPKFTFKCNGCEDCFAIENMKCKCSNCHNCCICEFKENCFHGEYKHDWELFNLDFSKKNTGKIWGIELEAVYNYADDVENHYQMRDEMGINRYPNFKVGHDGSISHYGCEFISCPFSTKHLETIKKQIAHMKCSFHVDKSCGLHVHLYINSRHQTLKNVRNIFYLFYKFETIFFGMNPKSRENNRFCKKIHNDFNLDVIKDMKRFNTFISYYYDRYITNKRETPQSKYNDKRYYWINFHSLFRHNTIENRLHSGTLNFNRIVKWIAINQKVIDYAIKHSFNDVKKLRTNDFYKKILKDKELIAYVKDRLKNFKRNKKTHKFDIDVRRFRRGCIPSEIFEKDLTKIKKSSLIGDWGYYEMYYDSRGREMYIGLYRYNERIWRIRFDEHTANEVSLINEQEAVRIGKLPVDMIELPVDVYNMCSEYIDRFRSEVM